MNFLAHTLLAGDTPALVVGGVVGDWIKGPLPANLPNDLARGVALHRAIDRFVDSHPAFRQSRARVSPERRRYAGVLVDIFYDHLLALHWTTFDRRPLTDYSAAVYRLIAERLDDLPVSSHPALRLMASEDWLASYAHISGIADVLDRMSRRARQPNPLSRGEQDFLADADGYATDFHVCLNDTRALCQRWLEEH